MIKDDVAISVPAHILAEIERGHQAFSKRGRFDLDHSSDLRTLPLDRKIAHHRDSIINALAQNGREVGGQPPMVEKFRATVIMVDWLEAIGVPFAVCPNSRMNKIVHRLLNEDAERSLDGRKSRRKKISREAVRPLLGKVRYLRALRDHFMKFRPYAD
jgi:hypothetical protein